MLKRYGSSIALAFIAAIALIVVSLSVAYADEHEGENIDLMYNVTKDVSAFSICRQMTSRNANTVFVPTKTLSEWSSVVNNGIPNVDINSCGTTEVSGCMTQGYDNYDSSANVPAVCECNANRHYDGSNCVSNNTDPHAGCMNSGYDNYDPTATVSGSCQCNAGKSYQNGSCQVIVITGCRTAGYDNYNSQANADGACTCNAGKHYDTNTASCVTNGTSGCMTSGYDNYNPEATTPTSCVCNANRHYDASKGGCTPNPVLGCTDPAAANYYAAATYDDGSCAYNGGWSDWGACTNGTQSRSCSNPAPVNGGAACSGPSTQTCFVAVYGCTDPAASNYNPVATVDYGTCSYDGGWSDWSICFAGTQSRSCTNPAPQNGGAGCDGPTTQICGGQNFVYGCTDQSASNYNAAANYDDGTCTYNVCSTPGYDNTGSSGSCTCNSGRHYDSGQQGCVNDSTSGGGDSGGGSYCTDEFVCDAESLSCDCSQGSYDPGNGCADWECTRCSDGDYDEGQSACVDEDGNPIGSPGCELTVYDGALDCSYECSFGHYECQ
ncbi:MAG TPA: thrombospondin type-1 domain-containing protein [Candidatus Paceibacterota bacterium]